MEDDVSDAVGSHFMRLRGEDDEDGNVWTNRNSTLQVWLEDNGSELRANLTVFMRLTKTIGETQGT